MKIYDMPGTLKSVLLPAFVAMLSLLSPSLAAGANYPLELVSPRAAGSSPASGNAAISAGHRIFRAYPGLEYNIRAVVVGGAYPYTFSLEGAPEGMVIDEHTGEITWPNPQSSASPSITVRDSEGTSRSSTWAINVATTGFKFVDAATGSSSGDGSRNNPWRSLSDVRNNGRPGDIVYFRSGIYTHDGIPRVGTGGDWERVELSSGSTPLIWLAYPGERPIIDFGFVPGSNPGAMIRLSGENIYLDGFEARNARVIGFQLTSGSRYPVLRRLRMHSLNTIRVNLDGSNAGLIMTTSGYSSSNEGGSPSTWSQYTAIQDNEFFNAPADMAIKTYSLWKALIEDNIFRDMYYGVELKADMPQFTYRGNIHHRIPGRAIGGNMHSYSTHGEILFNLVNEPSGQFALDINQDSQARRIDVYRNTFVGRVRVRNTDSNDGPFNFSYNVIVNNDNGTPSGSHIVHENVSAPSRIAITANLAGYPADNIVDSNGQLSSGYSQYFGTHGYQLSGQASRVPMPPEQVSVE